MAIANQSTSAGAIVFGTGTTEKMRMTSTGKFSIGNTNDTYTLDVSGTVRNTTSAYFATTSGVAVIGATSANAISKLSVRIDATHAIAFEAISPAGNKSIYIAPVDSGTHLISSNYITGSPYLPLAISARENTSDLYLAINGNVGIATSSPNRPLEIATTTGIPAIRINSTAAGGNAGIEILTAATKVSWLIGAQYNVDQAFEITPSTTNGGTTFSTPALVIKSGGNVLINTATDNGDRLQIKGTIGIGFNTTTDSGAAITSYFSSGTSNSFLSLGTSYGVASGGDVALQLFTTGKTIYVRNVSAGVYMSQGSTSWTANSDETIKDIIEPITNGLDKLKDLRTVIYKLKDDETEQRKVGLIAQDVEKVLPEAIVKTYQKDYDREILGLNYTDLIPVLINAVQELSKQNEELSNRLIKLENK